MTESFQIIIFLTYILSRCPADIEVASFKSDIQAPRYGNNPRGFHASNMEYRLTYRDCLGNFY